jgi:hypothetical protein
VSSEVFDQSGGTVAGWSGPCFAFAASTIFCSWSTGTASAAGSICSGWRVRNWAHASPPRKTFPSARVSTGPGSPVPPVSSVSFSLA